MVLDCLDVFEAYAAVRLHASELVNQTLDSIVHSGILRVGEVSIQNFIHDFLYVFASKHFLSTCHLENYASKRPQISVQARLAL